VSLPLPKKKKESKGFSSTTVLGCTVRRFLKVGSWWKWFWMTAYQLEMINFASQNQKRMNSGSLFWKKHGQKFMENINI